jgi:hypothetical protein
LDRSVSGTFAVAIGLNADFAVANAGSGWGAGLGGIFSSSWQKESEKENTEPKLNVNELSAMARMLSYYAGSYSLSLRPSATSIGERGDPMSSCTTLVSYN